MRLSLVREGVANGAPRQFKAIVGNQTAVRYSIIVVDEVDGELKSAVIPFYAGEGVKSAVGAFVAWLYLHQDLTNWIVAENSAESGGSYNPLYTGMIALRSIYDYDTIIEAINNPIKWLEGRIENE